MERAQGQRRRGRRRAVVLLAVAGVLGALLTVPVQTIGAPRAQAAEVPECPPDSTTNNCIPPDQTYDGATHPDIPELGPVEPAGGLLVRQKMTVEGPTIGGMCPFGGIPYSAMPCTHFGVNAGGRVYVPGGDQAGSPSDYGINVSDETREGYTCSGWSQDFTCPLVITYNPSTLSGSVTLIISVSTTVVGDLNHDGNILDGLSYSFAITVSGTGTPPPEDENHPPVAAFSYERVSPNDFALYRFTSQASDPDAGDSVSGQTWEFGDGEINVGPQVIHTFAKPGDYTVTHRVVDSHGLASTGSQIVHVPAPSLRVDVSLPDAVNNQLAPGVPTRAHVTVSAGDDGTGALSSIAFVGGPLQVTPNGALTVDTPLVPTPVAGLALAPGESRAFDAVVHGDGSGRFTLAATARAVDASGREVAPVTGQVEGTISGLAVQLRSADTGEDTIDVVVSVTNQGTAPIDGIQYTGGGLAVHPEYVPDALRGTVTLVSGPRPALPTSLAPGETREATYTFHAEGPGDVAVVAEATSPAAGGTISANDAGFIGIQKRVLDTKALKNLLVELAESEMVNLQGSARLRQQLLDQAMNARVLAARAQGALVDLPSELVKRASGPIVPYPEFDNATLTKVALWGQAKGLAQGVGKVLDFTIGTPAEYYAGTITSGSFGQMAQDYVDAGLAAKGAADTAAYGTFSTALNLYDRYIDDPGGAFNQQQYADLTEALNDEYKGQMLEFAEYAPQLDAQSKAFDQYLEEQGDAILHDPYGWADKVTTAAGELEGETLAGEAAARGGAKLFEHVATSFEYSKYGKSGAAIKRVTEAETLEALGAGETTAANVERLGGITEADQQKIQQVIGEVKEKFGVDLEIQARPSNPYSVEYLNSKLGALGKPEIFKAKNLSDIDVILGADPQGLGKLGVFEPKLPPDSVMAKMPPEVANEVKLRFKTQEGVWKDWNDPTSKFAKNYKKAAQPGGGTFEFDVPTAEGDLAPNAPREYKIEVGTTKPGRNNTVSFYEKGTGRPIVSDIDFHGYFKTNGKALDAGTRGQIELYLQNRWKQTGISFGDHGATLNGFDWAGSGTPGGAVARHKFGLEFMEPAAARARAEELSQQLGVPVEELLKGYTPGKFVVTFRRGQVAVGYGKTF